MNDHLKNLVEDVDGALGAAVVDLNTGLLLGVYHTIPYFTQSYLDAVAAASVEMLRGKTVQAVEKMLSAQRGEEVRHMIKEIQMTTDNTYHFMSIVPGKPDALLIMVTKRTTNLGMGWTAMRRALEAVAPLCP
ncbi:MAG: hypothetical protein D6771_04780 [Zetaproteobacteria bacterium]|nr:MAG: hypothetical protein D6771_04780 [Zetaproteobacteria bacterium]